MKDRWVVGGLKFGAGDTNQLRGGLCFFIFFFISFILAAQAQDLPPLEEQQQQQQQLLRGAAVEDGGGAAAAAAGEARTVNQQKQRLMDLMEYYQVVLQVSLKLEQRFMSRWKYQFWLVGSLKPSILSLASSQMDQTFWGVASAAVGRLGTWGVHLRPGAFGTT